jgi:hypothetical protein
MSDPMVRKPTRTAYTSRAIVYAVKPFDWWNEFAPVSIDSEEAANRVRKNGNTCLGVGGRQHNGNGEASEIVSKLKRRSVDRQGGDRTDVRGFSRPRAVLNRLVVSTGWVLAKYHHVWIRAWVDTVLAHHNLL